jgi:hypothetical protein
MKRTLNFILLIALSISPAFAFDPPQRIGFSVIIDKELLDEIDKIYVLKDCSTDSQRVEINTESYFFIFYPKSVVKIKLKNQNQLYPTSIRVSESIDRIHICKESNNIIFKIEKYTDFKANAPLLFSIYLLLIIKFIVTLLIIKPTSKIDFLKKYGLFFLILFMVLFAFSDSWSLMFIIVSFLCLVAFMILDFAFLLDKYKKKGILAFAVSSIIATFLGIILFNLDI